MESDLEFRQLFNLNLKGRRGKGSEEQRRQGSQSEQDGVEGLARWVVRAPNENTQERGAFKFLPLLSS